MLNPQQYRRTVALISLGLLLLSQVSSTVGGVGCNVNATCLADMERYYLAGLQAKILQSLHLHSPLRNVTIPKISPETLAELLADDKDETSSKRVIFFSRECAIDTPNCIAFDVSQSTLDLAIDSKLRFYVDLSSFGLMEPYEGETIPVSIKISRVLENGEIDEYPFVNEIVNMGESQRMEMDIELRELKNWKAEGDIELKITAEYQNGQATINLPTLVIDTEQPRKRDRRNSDNYCPAGSTDKTCCLHDMIIDFQKLGWHFIMAPRIYNAYMCRGDCDSGINHILRFGHSKLLKDARQENANNCCHPSDYESLKIIYTRADNEVIITRVPGMIARRCSCS